MKSASFLSEISTVNSDPSNSGGGQAPTFGRDKDVLETTSGSIASVPSGVGGMMKRGKGSMFKGISTSNKFANSKKTGVNETEEEMLDEILGFQISRTPQQRPKTSGIPLSQIRQQVQTDPSLQGNPDKEKMFHSPEEYQAYAQKNKLKNKLVAAEGEVTDLDKEYGAPATRKRQSNMDPSDHNPYPFSREDDEDYFREIFRKKREAAAKNNVVKEFAADDGGDGGEEDVLHKYARMWWSGDDATQLKIESALDRMGWEIGQDEGGYDNGGVFVVRAGDINGNSYMSWPAEDLTEGVAEGSDKYAELSKKIQDLAQAGKEGEANKLRYELNRLLMLDRDKQRRKERGVAEGNIDEDEQLDGMALGELKAIAQDAKKIYDVVKNGTPLEAWMYKKITNSNEALTAVAQQVDNPDIREPEEEVDEGENWSKYNHKRVGGMSKKSVSSYRRSHPGSKIQTAVTTKPSKLKKGSKSAKRRASFCARMRGMKKHRTGAKTAHDPNSNINKSLRRWHCESIEELQELVMIAEQKVNEAKNFAQQAAIAINMKKHHKKPKNDKVDESEISEEMLRDKLTRELLDFFEKGRPKDLSNKPKDKEIQKKEKK